MYKDEVFGMTLQIVIQHDVNQGKYSKIMWATPISKLIRQNNVVLGS